MRYVVDLNFWHLAVRAILPTAADADHFRFQFRAHLTARDTSPDVTLRFSCGGSGSWCEALLNPRQVKTVEYSLDGSRFVTYETWLNASRRVSPLPPIPFMERSVRPYAAHAACAEVPAMPGKAAVITGASGGGKTSLLLYLLDAGWAYAADDLLPFRNGKAWTYLRTMNVRHHTFDLHISALARSHRQERPGDQDTVRRNLPGSSGRPWLPRVQRARGGSGPENRTAKRHRLPVLHERAKTPGDPVEPGQSS